MLFFHSFTRRSADPEWMDDLEIHDGRLTDALADLKVINRYLGGFSTSVAAFESVIGRLPAGKSFRILDVGAGAGDFAEELIQWAVNLRPDLDISITCLDYNKATVEWADGRLRRSLPPCLARRIICKVGDVFNLSGSDEKFDIVHCALFLHHFSDDDVVRLLRTMSAMATSGIVVNDLQRHPVAFSSIKFLTQALNASSMVKHDGPLSVRRGFTRDELIRLASAADLTNFKLSWHWAFRWLLTTVGGGNV